jgi:hypothetical protein
MFIQYANNFWVLKVIFSIILQYLHQEVWTKTTMGFGFSADNFSASKGISFQLGKTRWNYYNQEEKYKD